MRQSLGTLARALRCDPPADADGVIVSGIAEDSRAVHAGDLFVAIPGTRADGATYIADAVRGGAVAVVRERAASDADSDRSVPTLIVEDARVALARLAAIAHGDATRSLFAVGVTGTNGKTTTCHLLARLLGEERCTVVGTVSNRARDLPAVTTPSALAVQRLAAESLQAGRGAMIIEASSAGISQRRVHGVHFDVAIYTGFGSGHEGFHGGVDRYFDAKLGLFRALDPGSTAVLNADDRRVRSVARACRCATTSFGLERADWRASHIVSDSRHTRFRLHRGAEQRDLVLPLPGRHNVRNALAAAAAAALGGLELDSVVKRLAPPWSIPGRWERFRSAEGAEVIVDFAHTPGALEEALGILRAEARRLVAVFGCPGDEEHGLCEAMGAVAGRLADHVVLTADNPKERDPE
ncbi:MAG: UDP-N-acetylmuramyl-tripeptide synthetase, partial [Candidatus Bipolaricaulota bacterium]